MLDSSEGIACPIDVSSNLLLGESPGALQDLELTDTDSLGDVIRGRIAEAEAENARRGQRGRSWALDGRNPAVVWQTRDGWLTSVAVELGCAQGLQACRKRGLSPRTALFVARACARFADAQTGRGVTASNRTLGRIAAELAGRAKEFCHDVVGKARAVLAELGCAVEVAQGRYLTADERFQSAVHHDGVQLRAASTWALVSPRRWHTKSYLPRRGPTGSSTPRSSKSPKHARKRAKAPSGRSQRGKEQRRSRAAHIVTAQLVAGAPSLDTGRHLGALVDVVAEFVDCHRWTGRDLIATLNQDARDNPRDWPSTIHNAASFLHHRLSRLAHVLAGPAPSEVAAQHRERVAEEQRRRAAEAAAAHERKASGEQVAKHMDAIRAELKSKRATRGGSSVERGR